MSNAIARTSEESASPRRPPVLALLAVVLMALTAVGCDERLADLVGPTPSLTPTFRGIRKEILDTTDSSGRPACISCRATNGRLPAGGPSLLAGASCASLTEAPSRFRVEGASGIARVRMPRNGPAYLTGEQVQIIRRWVQPGAKTD